jgi:cyclopropane-fatty-acyl-phospholipid synthase
LIIHDPRFYTRTALHGNIGLGESYMAGEWSCEDLAGLLTVLASIDRSTPHRRFLRWSRLSHAVASLRHVLRPNSRRGSRRNIVAHYDLGNEFFETFLDPTMQYSCARFDAPTDSLEAAQNRKMDAIMEKANLQATDHVLEIGCGWGAFAVRAARRVGCKVTAVTLSDQQYERSRRRVTEAGLEGQVSVRRCDYRDIDGQFDKIVSIEMLEAVGHAYLGAFFHTCDRLLRDGGRVALQVITIPDQRYETYRRGSDWIQKHIFPGGLLPSLNAMSAAMTLNSRLVVDRLEGMGLHYASTLRVWRHAFERRADVVAAQGFDEAFRRKWIYYFAYCEAGFATRYLNVLQMVLRRPGPAG